jgi:septum formation protein
LDQWAHLRLDLIILFMRLVLASASPRRAALLRAAGFAFEVLEAGIEERPLTGEQPADYVRRVAVDKAATVAEKMRAAQPDASEVNGAQAPHVWPPELVVVGADTEVVIDGGILGKPRDAQEATAMLRWLAGRTHDVLTGLSVLASGTNWSWIEATAVQFKSLTERELAWYEATGEWRGKAGGYAIQGLASRFIGKIDGSYSNVVGLPLAPLCRLLANVTRVQSTAGAA